MVLQNFFDCSKDLKEHCTIVPFIAVLNIPCVSPNLKAIHNDPECPLVLRHLNNASKSLTTRHCPAQVHGTFFLQIMIFFSESPSIHGNLT